MGKIKTTKITKDSLIGEILSGRPELADKLADYGVLICGTGIGMSIAANKVLGIRAAAIQSEFAAIATKAHNNANVLCVGSRTNTLEEVLHFVDLFFQTEFENGPRHHRRIEMITNYEEKK